MGLGLDSIKMGSIGERRNQGVLIWRMLRNTTPSEGDNRLLSLAMKCWAGCMRATQGLIKYALEIPLVGLPRVWDVPAIR